MKTTFSADLDSISVVSKLGQVARWSVDSAVASLAAAEVLAGGHGGILAVVRHTDAFNAECHALEACNVHLVDGHDLASDLA